MESPAPPELGGRSPKSYATAVCLSSTLGWIGVQHFYLGRWVEGMLDVGLTAGWIIGFATDQPLLGLLFLAGDLSHALRTTVLLLTGDFRDGEGRRVCYPGQRFGPKAIG